MTSKQLWEAAMRLDEIPDAAPDFRAVVAYVLDRVKPDDDEPVTPGRLIADGWKYNTDDEAWYSGDVERPCVTWSKTNVRLWTWSMDHTVKSMGQLRLLIQALGE